MGHYYADMMCDKCGKLICECKLKKSKKKGKKKSKLKTKPLC